MPANETKDSVLFLCHSHEDKDFTDQLVKLLETIGFDSSTLFYSSNTKYGLKPGDNIIESICDKFSNKRLFVLYVLSPRVYKSAMSLNEMGAAWVLSTENIKILTPDMSSDKIKGVVDDGKLAIKFTDPEEIKHRLSEMKNELIDFFELEDVEPINWNNQLEYFISFMERYESPKPNDENDLTETIEVTDRNEVSNTIQNFIKDLRSNYCDKGETLSNLSIYLQDVMNKTDFVKFDTQITMILSAQDNWVAGFDGVKYNWNAIRNLISDLKKHYNL